MKWSRMMLDPTFRSVVEARSTSRGMAGAKCLWLGSIGHRNEEVQQTGYACG